MLIQSLCVVFLTPTSLVCVYYVSLAILSIILKRHERDFSKEAVHSFAIVIPAHDEEAVISGVLKSCASLDYPKDKYRVFVIADNCTDQTAQKATSEGAVCLERNVERDRGKGFALEWAFERILPQGFDAVVVVDADCSLEEHALRVFDKKLSAGDRVLQTRIVASNPEDSVISYVLAVGNLIENDLFHGPKSRLGLTVPLRGTGMVFHRDILVRHAWRAHSIAEDAEYALSLLEEGIPVKFVSEVAVFSKYPADSCQLKIQRSRWAAGTFSFSKANALRLILRGVYTRNISFLDAGWTLLVLSRPLILAGLVSTVALSGLSHYLAPGEFSDGLLWSGMALLITMAMYFLFGMMQLGLNPRRLALFLKSPVVIFDLIVISVWGFISPKNIWLRTPR